MDPCQTSDDHDSKVTLDQVVLNPCIDGPATCMGSRSPKKNTHSVHDRIEMISNSIKRSHPRSLSNDTKTDDTLDRINTSSNPVKCPRLTSDDNDTKISHQIDISSDPEKCLLLTSHGNETQTSLEQVDMSSSSVNPSDPISHDNDTLIILDEKYTGPDLIKLLGPTSPDNDTLTIIDQTDPSHTSYDNDTLTILDQTDPSGHTSYDNDTLTIFESSGPISYVNESLIILDETVSSNPSLQFNDTLVILDVEDTDSTFVEPKLSPTSHMTSILIRDKGANNDTQNILDEKDTGLIFVKPSRSASFGNNTQTIFDRMDTGSDFEDTYDEYEDNDNDDNDDEEYNCGIKSNNLCHDPLISPEFKEEQSDAPLSPSHFTKFEDFVARECENLLEVTDATEPASSEDVEAVSDGKSASPRKDEVRACSLDNSVGETASSNEETRVADDEVTMDADSNTFSWFEDFSKFKSRQEIYSKWPGPRSEVQHSPADLFLHVWDLPFVTHIVEETNRHAWRTISELSDGRGVFKKNEVFRDTNVTEIYNLFVIFIYMSICCRSSIDEYWTTACLGMPEFRDIMTRNRFRLLSTFLNFVDNDTIQHGLKKQNIAKIEPVITHCNDKFSSMYVPEQALSLDETLLLWKDHLLWVKGTRGIKSYELCEASSGYMLRTLMYTSKNSQSGANDNLDNTTEKVVLELMDGYLDRGHTLLIDNWYNQLPLARYLKKNRCTDCVGTINRRSTLVPKAIKTIDENRVTRDDQIARHSGDITIIAWKDVEIVTAISTFHNDNRSTQTECKTAGGKISNKPKLLEYYYKNKGGVNRKDLMITQYLMEPKKCYKWYIKVFKRLLNISLFNTYILYSKSPASVLTFHEFRYKVAEGLLLNESKSKISFSLPTSDSELFNPKRVHFPLQTEMDPHTKTLKSRRCARCSAKGKVTHVTTTCGVCKVALCLGQCWIDYHTLINI